MNLEPVFVLIGLWIICLSNGYWLIVVLWPRRWASGAWIAMAVLGAGWLMILSATANYLGFALQLVALPLISLGPVLGGALYWLGRGRYKLAIPKSEPATITAVGLSAAAITMLSLVVYRAWDPYNDTFAYCAVADYLLHTSYLTPADPGAYHPMLAVVKSFQLSGWSGWRLGTQFLLGLSTAAFGYRFSCDVYMPFAALGIWLGVSGMWVFCRNGLVIGRRPSLIASLFYGFHLGVPIPIALDGFLAQTWATAFMLAALTFWLGAVSRRDSAKCVTLTALCLAVLLLTYPVIVPFALAAAGAVLGMQVLARRVSILRGLLVLLSPVVIVGTAAPGLIYRAAGEIAVQPGLAVGWDPRLDGFDYLLMIAGHQSLLGGLGSGSGLIYLPIKLAATASMALIVYGALRGRRHATLRIGALSLVFAAALAYYMTLVINPWRPGEIGSPYQTLKAFSFGFFLLPPLWALGFELASKGGLGLRMTALATAGILGVSVVPAAQRLALAISQPMQRFVATTADPVGEYKRLVKIIDVLPGEEPVNLVIGSPDRRHQWIVAYYLRRPVVATWNDDYVSGWLKEEYRNPRFDLSHPTLLYAPASKDVVAAGFKLERNARLIWRIGDGWYPTENDDASSWNWLEQRGYIDIIAAEQMSVVLSAKLWVVGGNRTVSVSVEGQPGTRLELPLAAGVHMVRTKPLTVSPGTHRVVIAVDGSPVTFPPDPRRLSVQVVNLDLRQILDTDR